MPVFERLPVPKHPWGWWVWGEWHRQWLMLSAVRQSAPQWMPWAVAPQTQPHIPCSCSCAEKWEMGRHFFKEKSQGHPYELHWIPQRPWKASNENYTEAKNFTKISGIPVSAVIWATSIHCRLSNITMDLFMLPQFFKTGEEWHCSTRFKNEQKKKA